MSTLLSLSGIFPTHLNFLLGKQELWAYRWSCCLCNGAHPFQHPDGSWREAAKQFFLGFHSLCSGVCQWLICPNNTGKNTPGSYAKERMLGLSRHHLGTPMASSALLLGMLGRRCYREALLFYSCFFCLWRISDWCVEAIRNMCHWRICTIK